MLLAESPQNLTMLLGAQTWTFGVSVGVHKGRHSPTRTVSGLHPAPPRPPNVLVSHNHDIIFVPGCDEHNMTPQISMTVDQMVDVIHARCALQTNDSEYGGVGLVWRASVSKKTVLGMLTGGLLCP